MPAPRRCQHGAAGAWARRMEDVWVGGRSGWTVELGREMHPRVVLGAGNENPTGSLLPSPSALKKKKKNIQMKCFSESVAAFKSGGWWREVVAQLQQGCRYLRSGRPGDCPPLDGGDGDPQGKTRCCRRTETLRRGERSGWWGSTVLPPSKGAEMSYPLPRQADLPVPLRIPHYSWGGMGKCHHAAGLSTGKEKAFLDQSWCYRLRKPITIYFCLDDYSITQ